MGRVSFRENEATAIEFSLVRRCLEWFEPISTGNSNTNWTDQFDGRSPTPALESSKDFKLLVHHRTEVDLKGVFRDEATVFEFSPLMPRMG